MLAEIKKFAEENAGRRVKIIGKLTDNDLPYNAAELYGMIVGYHTSPSNSIYGTDKYISVNFEEERDNKKCYHQDFVQYFAEFNRGWFVEQRAIQILHKPYNIVPYPHTCKKCKSPARKSKNIILCSNTKCSSTNKNNYIVKLPSMSIIKCPECNADVAFLLSTKKDKSGPTFVCKNGASHRFNYIPLVNDMMLSNPPYYFDGVDWHPCK